MQAIIVVTKNPIKGQVKTRLAASIGSDETLRVYLDLLSYTKTVVQSTADLFVFHTPELIEEFNWENATNLLQAEGDLGQRMHKAFETVFELGYSEVVLLGCDCFQITSNHIKDAFGLLSGEKNDVVLGPAKDGGYYLIGLTKSQPNLFKGVTWSTSEVFKQTISLIGLNELNYSCLQVLNDVDELADLPREYQKKY